MRILSVTHTADVYGASRCLERLAERLVRGGHELLVVMPSAGPLKDVLEQHGVTVRLHPLLSVVDRNTTRTWRRRLTLLATFPMSVAWLAVAIVRFRADVVHTNSGVVISPAFAARLTGRPHAWHVREFFVEFPRLWSRYERMMFRMSDAIIAISHAVRDQFSAAVQSKVWVVYDGLPRVAFQRSVVERAAAALRDQLGLAGRRSACMVGRLKWRRKGQEVFIRAAAILKPKYPDAKYVIVGTAAPGSEDHLERFKALAAELGVADDVLFTGDMHDTRPVYVAVDASVVASVDPEPFGCVVSESMALGTPVVGSGAAGIAEQIVDGDTGFLFPPGDHEALAASLGALFGDEQLRQQMAGRGHARFLDAFELEASYQEHMAVFEAVQRRARVGQRGTEGAAAR